MANDKSISEWYRAYQGDSKYLPGSQGQAHRLLQAFYIPAQALVALISGRRLGDINALKFFLRSDEIICEVCGAVLDRQGEGHDPKCKLMLEALEIINSKVDPAQRTLEAEQQKLQAKLDQTKLQLESMARRERERE